MKKEYYPPAVLTVDLCPELFFCMSGSLENTFDEPLYSSWR